MRQKTVRLGGQGDCTGDLSIGKEQFDLLANEIAQVTFQ